jgi:hypothetical protein
VQKTVLPAGSWRAALDGGVIPSRDGLVTIEAYSAAILYQ